MPDLPEITLTAERDIPREEKPGKGFSGIKVVISLISLLVLLASSFSTGYFVGGDKEQRSAKALIESAQVQSMFDAEQVQGNHLDALSLKDEAVFRLEGQVSRLEASLVRERTNVVRAQEELGIALVEINQLNTAAENAVQPLTDEREVAMEQPEPVNIPQIHFSVVGTRAVNGVKRLTVLFNDKLRNLNVNENIDGWRLLKIDSQEATFMKSDVVQRVAL